MRVEVWDEKGVRVLTCAGALVLEGGADALVRAFDKAVEDGRKWVVIDLQALEKIDSAGVGAVVACAKHAGDRGAVVKIAVPPRGLVRKVFEITHLDRAFEVFPDVRSALVTFPR